MGYRFSILSAVLLSVGACGGVEVQGSSSMGDSAPGGGASGAAGMAASNQGIGGTAVGMGGGTTSPGTGGSPGTIVVDAGRYDDASSADSARAEATVADVARPDVSDFVDARGASANDAIDVSIDTNAGDAAVVDEPSVDAPDAFNCVTGNTLDPREVYLAGTLVEGLCGEDALAHWQCPNVAAVGFDCNFQGNSTSGATTMLIRPTDGRLIYLNITDGLIHEFNCDDCPHLAGDPYPTVTSKTIRS